MMTSVSSFSWLIASPSVTNVTPSASSCSFSFIAASNFSSIPPVLAIMLTGLLKADAILDKHIAEPIQSKSAFLCPQIITLEEC